MKRYRAFLYAWLLATVLYVAVGNYTWMRGSYEVFPVFAWELFSYVPGAATDYGVRLTQIGGAPLTPPRYFEEAAGLVRDTHSIEAYVVIQDLGRAVESGDADAVAQARTTLESLYLDGLGAVTYDLYQRRASPLARAQSGAFDEEQQLATFEAGAQ
jgi:hypothetical protein